MGRCFAALSMTGHITFTVAKHQDAQNDGSSGQHGKGGRGHTAEGLKATDQPFHSGGR